MTAVIDPGLEIGRVTQPEYPTGFDGPAFHTCVREQSWNLTDSGTYDFYCGLVDDDRGRIYMRRGTRMARSTDGRAWELVGGAIPGVIGFVPWKDGLVLDVWQQGLEHWTPASDETVSCHRPSSLPSPAQGRQYLCKPVNGDSRSFAPESTTRDVSFSAEMRFPSQLRSKNGRKR